MASARFSLILTILFSSICTLFADQTTNIPVLLWPKSEDTRFVGSLPEYKKEDFQKLLSEQIKEDTTLIVFLSDVLNTNQLSCRTVNEVTCFTKTSQIKGKWYIPSVDEPNAAITDVFKSDPNIEVYVKTNGEFSEKIQSGRKQVVFVTLPPIQQGETEEAYLGSCDRIIAEKSAELANDKVVFIYTGRSNGLHSRKARSAVPALSETAPSSEKQQTGPQTSDPTFFRNDNFLIYYTGLYEVNKKKEQKPISISSLAVSVVDDHALNVELKGDRTIKLDVRTGGGYWAITQGSIDGNEFSGQSIIAALSGFSYHCSPALTFNVNHTDTVAVKILGLQVEPKFKTPVGPLTRYSPAQDCVGFTSAGIWAGLFVVIMLLVILSIGIAWIMDIRTMDRFDDPKGKTITIGNAE